MLIDNIKAECWYVFLLWIIIIWGLLLCDIANRKATLEEWYQSYEYNIDCDSGSGWIDSIVTPEKKP